MKACLLVTVLAALMACGPRPPPSSLSSASSAGQSSEQDPNASSAVGKDGAADVRTDHVSEPPSDADGPPADVSLRPSGVGWFCTASSNSADFKPCFRKQTDCNAQVAKNPAVFAPCTASKIAHCFTKMEGSGYGPKDKTTGVPPVTGWRPRLECSATPAACSNHTRARSVGHQRKDGPISLHKDISRCTGWE